jgi:hypothetical protein
MRIDETPSTDAVDRPQLEAVEGHAHARSATEPVLEATLLTSPVVAGLPVLLLLAL